MISLWMEEERKQTIRRIRRGLSQAQKQGKWTGRPPKGFETDDNGFLQVNMEEYLAIRDALERVDDGESLRSVASDTRFNRQTLSDLYQDRCEWYLSAEAENEDDERVRKALEQVDG
jgi:DNA invertase Pin-like site-specific DNA recombinase